MQYKDEKGADKSVFLKPVSPLRFKEIFRLAKRFGGNAEQTLEKMDDETITDLVTLCTETLDRSCPDWTKEQKEEFITINFNELVRYVFEINTPK